MSERDTQRIPLAESLAACAGKGLRIGIALGAFGLIHAGTTRFLAQGRARCDRLFAAILPEGNLPGASEQAAALLRPDERLRILRMMEAVDGAAFLETAEECRRAAPEALWMSAEDEADIDPSTRADLDRLGIALEPIATPGACTTRSLLERIAR